MDMNRIALKASVMQMNLAEHDEEYEEQKALWKLANDAEKAAGNPIRETAIEARAKRLGVI
ncbi:hypothetical protein IWQ49_006557 [Labrenzia sp. EL_126]|nr:hypothetical protein [Labrenzia sp. EL_126]